MKFANWDALASFASDWQPTSYLEVGVMSGESLRVVLDHCNPARVTLCDIWDPAVYRGHPYANHGHVASMLSDEIVYKGQVTFLDGNSHVLLPTLREEFDLIHVDGDHSEFGAMQDLMDCWRLLAPGGHLVFDDVQRPELLGVLTRFLHQLAPLHIVDDTPYQISLLELEKADGVAVIQKV